MQAEVQRYNDKPSCVVSHKYLIEVQVVPLPATSTDRQEAAATLAQQPAPSMFIKAIAKHSNDTK